jgi:hypothetical protein
MALGNRESAIYLSIRNGKVFRYSKTQEEGTIAIKNKEGVERFYFVYDYVDGIVTSIKTKKETFAGQEKTFLVVTLTDEGENFNIEIDMKSNYFQSFANAVINGDVNKPYKLIPTMKEVDGKKNTGMIIMQDGNAIKWKYTKENPGEMPDIVVTKNKKGEVVDVDRDDRNNFLLSELDTWLSGAITGKSSLPATASLIDESELEVDDLPF